MIDETGCMLSPLVRRSLAPRGRTPLLRQKGSAREKVSVIAGLSLSPRRRRVGLYFQTFPNGNVNHERAADFLRLLLRQLGRKLVVVWDNASMHRGPDVRRLLSRSRRIRIEPLPTYAPELNPVEYLWSRLKYGNLANRAAIDARQLDDVVTHELESLRPDHEHLASFYRAAPLPYKNPTLLF